MITTKGKNKEMEKQESKIGHDTNSLFHQQLFFTLEQFY